MQMPEVSPCQWYSCPGGSMVPWRCSRSFWCSPCSAWSCSSRWWPCTSSIGARWSWALCSGGTPGAPHHHYHHHHWHQGGLLRLAMKPRENSTAMVAPILKFEHFHSNNLWCYIQAKALGRNRKQLSAWTQGNDWMSRENLSSMEVM